MSEQVKKQRLFMDALYVVANVGYDKEVRAVFSLNRGTWTDFRLWSVIINDKIKRTERKRDKDYDFAYYTEECEETRLIHQVRVGRESSVLRLLRLVRMCTSWIRTAGRPSFMPVQQGERGW
jgi:hypothetical protein